MFPNKPTSPAAPAPAAPAPAKGIQTPVIAPVIPPVEAPAQPAAPPKTDELLKRIAEAPPAAPALAPEERLFSSAELKAELDKITDPSMRAMFEGVYNNMDRGLQKKFMEISELKKQTNQPWTLDRIKQVSADPSFLSAAQQYMQQMQPAPAAPAPPSNFAGNSQDWSMLSESDKAYIQTLEQKSTMLEQKVNNLLSTQDQFQVSQADTEIKQRIPSYNPSEVNQLQNEIAGGRWSQAQIREALWKAKNFDSVVQQTYQLALMDRSGGLLEKLAASTSPTVTVSTPATTLAPQPGEARGSFFKRIAEEKLQQARAKLRL